MKRLAIIVAITAALGLSSAPAAVGAPFTPELNRAYDLAAEWWGAPPSCPNVDRQIVPAELLTVGGIANWGGALVPVAVGQYCGMWISRLLAAPRERLKACGVVIHEYGHLLGLPHDDDPNSIMYPQLLQLPAACAAWGRREARRRELERKAG